MTDFHSLDPQTRCIALVGQYLQLWALMEGKLRDAIQKALGLDGLQSYILANNMQLRDKINLLKTLVDLTKFETAERQKGYFDLLTNIANASGDRNMMAHDIFAPTEDGKAVDFLTIKAKGKLSFPSIVWTVDTFEDRYAKIDGFREALKDLESQLSLIRMAEIIAYDDMRTKQLTSGLGSLFGQRHQHQPVRGSILQEATPEKDRETPPAQPTKAPPGE